MTGEKYKGWVVVSSCKYFKVDTNKQGLPNYYPPHFFTKNYCKILDKQVNDGIMQFDK